MHGKWGLKVLPSSSSGCGPKAAISRCSPITSNSEVPRRSPFGGGAFRSIYQLLLLKKKVEENAVANSLAACLTFDQLAGKFENISGSVTSPRYAIRTSLTSNCQKVNESFSGTHSSFPLPLSNEAPA